MIVEHIYIAIRKSADTGHEWADAISMRGNPTSAMERAKQTDNLMPEWAGTAPVIRIGRFTATEVREG